MTYLIHRSLVPDAKAFAEAVRLHAIDLENYAKHLESVRAKKADPYPSPNPHPAIDAAVRRDGSRFVVDYEIVDVLPVAPNDKSALERRKEEFRQQIGTMEQEQLHKIIPRGKWRLSNLRYQAAIEKKEADRDSDHLIAINLFEKIRDHLRLVQMHYAEMESQIEDIDFATVNSWAPKPFEG